MSIRYDYAVAQTANGKVNFEKLDLEIRATTIPNYLSVTGVEGEISCKFSDVIPQVSRDELDALILAHDGEYAAINEQQVQGRELKIRELTALALNHPSLDNDEAVEYLTSIDNWFNGWKRSGIASALIAKISIDAANIAHPQHGFLNEVVNTDGNKTFEFLIAKIME